MAVVTSDEWPPQAANELLCTRHSRNGNWKASSSSSLRESYKISRSFCDFTLRKRMKIIELPHFTTDQPPELLRQFFPQKSWELNRNSRRYRAIKERLNEWFWYEAQSVLIAIQVRWYNSRRRANRERATPKTRWREALSWTDGWLVVGSAKPPASFSCIWLF